MQFVVITTLLLGLHDLLSFFVPAVFVLGCDVRELTWEGGVGGTATGLMAKRVLQRCLAVQVHLLQDWECQAEYTRTLSTALLQWHPWMSALPGCCFVEESCEALLSRMVGRCRTYSNLVSHDDILDLYVTLPLPALEPKHTVGGLSKELVYLLRTRLQRLLDHPESVPYAEVRSATEARWQLQFPVGFSLPQRPQAANDDPDFLVPVLRGALVCLNGASRQNAALQLFANTELAPLSPDARTTQSALQQGRLVEWSRERRRRLRQRPAPVITPLQTATTSQRPPPPPSPPAPSPHTAAPAAHHHGRDMSPDEPGRADGAASSQYEPPEDSVILSEGYQSYGDTDSFGSVGDLEFGNAANWTTLDEEGWCGAVKCTLLMHRLFYYAILRSWETTCHSCLLLHVCYKDITHFIQFSY